MANNDLNPEVDAEGISMPTDPKTFPPTYATHRPRYDADKPVSVLEYIKGCEEVMSACKVTDDRIKKKILIHYLDLISQQHWKSLGKWLTGTYEEFKAEIMSYHPTALREQKGGLTQLYSLCDTYRSVTMARPVEALQFILKFRAEAKKVVKQGVGNREIVSAFMGTLGETFREKIWEKVQPDTEISVEGELKLEYTALVDMAEKVLRARSVYDERFGDPDAPERTFFHPEATASRVRQGEAWEIEKRQTERGIAEMRASALREANSAPANPPQIHVKREPDLEVFAQRVGEIIDTRMKVQEENIKNLTEELKVTKDRVDILVRNPHNLGQNSFQPRPMRSENFGGMRTGCFYCLESGHYMGQCSHKALDAANGKIKDDPSGIYWPSGQRIAARPGESPRDCVARLTTKGAQAQNVQSYDGWENAQYQQSGEDEWATREDVQGLIHAFNQLSGRISTSNQTRPATAPAPAKPIANANSPWDGLNQLMSEQQKTNRLMEQFVHSVASSQFVNTRANAHDDAEDFQ